MKNSISKARKLLNKIKHCHAGDQEDTLKLWNTIVN